MNADIYCSVCRSEHAIESWGDHSYTVVPCDCTADELTRSRSHRAKLRAALEIAKKCLLSPYGVFKHDGVRMGLNMTLETIDAILEATK